VGQFFVLSLFPFLHGTRRKLTLTRTFGISVDFLRGLVTGDCHDLAVGRSKLCEARSTCFAKAVRRAMR
jgi:hypothetical protein